MAAIISALAAAAAMAPCLVGHWAMLIDGRPIMRLELVRTSAGPEARWQRPARFDFDGDTISDVVGPMVTRTASSIRLVDGTARVSFDDPQPGATPDVLTVECAAPDRLDVSFAGVAMAPIGFLRDRGGEAAPTTWDPTRFYTIARSWPTNTEMTAIFNADQADRQPTSIDWSIVRPADDRRRARTQQLLEAGKLQSGADFYHAAFVFQHGNGPDDYLKAHLLAMVAVARGAPVATWIAAASLDRYLRSIGRAQVLGTQFTVPNAGPASQEPYDRSLLPDALREALHVPSLAAQEKQRRQYTDEAQSVTKP